MIQSWDNFLYSQCGDSILQNAQLDLKQALAEKEALEQGKAVERRWQNDVLEKLEEDAIEYSADKEFVHGLSHVEVVDSVDAEIEELRTKNANLLLEKGDAQKALNELQLEVAKLQNDTLSGSDVEMQRLKDELEESKKLLQVQQDNADSPLRKLLHPLIDTCRRTKQLVSNVCRENEMQRREAEMLAMQVWMK